MSTDYTTFGHLKITIEDHVAFATIDAPPMNVMVRGLFSDLAKFGATVAGDDEVRVVVLRSDDPDFFIAHFDVAQILTFPTDGPAVKVPNSAASTRCARRTAPCPRPPSRRSAAESVAEATSWRCPATCGSAPSARRSSIRWKCRSASCPEAPAPNACPASSDAGAYGDRPGGRRHRRRDSRAVGHVEPSASTRRAASTRDRACQADRFVPADRGRAGQAVGRQHRHDELARRTDRRGVPVPADLRDPEAQRRMAHFLEAGGQTREGETRLTDVITEISRS